MSKNYIIKDEEGLKKYASCILNSTETISSLISDMKLNLLKALALKSYYISELASLFNTNEQNIYYHIKPLLPLLKIVETKKIRGVTAKKYFLTSPNICFSFSDSFKEMKGIPNTNKHNPFFNDFISDNRLNAKIVVGSPDPHGKYKARARDGHYAIDLALFLGSFCSISDNFSVTLDVDLNLKQTKQNLIIVGGPVTNLIMSQINANLPCSFMLGEKWSIKGRFDEYSDDNSGMIAKIPHPFYKEYSLLIIAGLRFTGTKSAVIGLTRDTKLILNSYTSQKSYYAIIQGYDLDGDSKVDNVELLESS